MGRATCQRPSTLGPCRNSAGQGSANRESDVTVFRDRLDAGRRLAQRLTHLPGNDLVILGIPRGGVQVAFEVAAALDAPLDVVVVRKLGVPFQPELAMGAIGEGGTRLIDTDMLTRTRVSDDEVRAVEQ